MSNHITRGTLPNPISMSPVALFSPACLRSPESPRPTRFDLPRTKCWYPTLAPLQPSTHFSSRHSISLVVSRLASLLPAIRGRIERSMGSMDYQSSATFGGQSWIITSVSPTSTTLRIFTHWEYEKQMQFVSI